jgi:hypothetical protein
MRRWLSVVVALTVASACSPTTDPPADGSAAESLTQTRPTHDTFAGAWRSVTRQAEFVRLTVHSLSREQGILGARLTFSGVYWEGTGRIEGDALVANMKYTGTHEPTRLLRARVTTEGVLMVQLQSESGAPLELNFVRDN